MNRISEASWVGCAGVLVMAMSVALGGCSSTSAPGGSGGSAGSGGSGGSGGGTGGCSGSTPVSLTVKNFEAWCSVSVAGGTASTGADITACVAEGTVTLTAEPASATFEIGKAPWTGTETDTVSGSTATATIDSKTTTCVAVCCPFAMPAGTGCPTTAQCP